MVLTTDIATHLQTDSVGTIGSVAAWGIYENTMPAAPDDCVAVFAYGGAAPDLSWAGEYPSVQVRVRGSTHATAYAKAYAVMQSLHETGRVTIDGTMYYWISAKHSPASLGRDAKGRHLYVVNFDVMKEFE